jgi:hypothetical protein
VPPALASPAPRPARWALLLRLLLLVLLGHALVLGLLPMGAGGGWQGGVRRTLQVRQIVRPVPPADTQAVTPMPPAPVPPAPASPPMRASPAVAPAPEPAGALPVAEAASAPEVVAVAAAEPAASAAAASVAAAAPESGGDSVPVYATRFAPAARLAYELRRGMLSGNGELLWRPAGARYELTMEGTAFGLSIIGWTSTGLIDRAGLAPERYVDRRRGRDVRAANFQRDKGLITFSGPQVEYPLVAGVQDRLSWMLQLPAIIEADAARSAPGERITMFVVGARGEGDLWTFRVEGVDSIEVPAGAVPAALHLRREPRRPYDTLVEVWLDPARHHLPARVRLSTPQTDDSTEFLLRELGP